MKNEKIINEKNSVDSQKENIRDNILAENQESKFEFNPSIRIYNDYYLEQNFSSNNSNENKFLDRSTFKKGEDLRESLLGKNGKSKKDSNSTDIKNIFFQKNLNAAPADNNVVKTLNFNLENPPNRISTIEKDKHNKCNHNKNNYNYNNSQTKTLQTKKNFNEENQNQTQINKNYSISETDDFGASAANLQFSTENLFSYKNLTILKQKLNFYFLKLRGFVYILFGCFLGTLSNFFYKYATQNGVDGIQLLLYRGINITVFSCLYLYLYFPELKEQFDKKQINSLISRALINSIGMSLILTSLNYLRLSTLELLLRTGNLMSVFLGYYMINEVVTRWDLLSLFGTFIGIIFILKPNFIFGEAEQSGRSPAEDTAFGIFLATSCAFLVAIANILTKKLLSFFNEIYLILVMGITSILFGIFFITVNSLDFGIGVFFSVYCAFVTSIEFFFYLYTFKSFKYESVTKLSPFFNSRIVFSVILTYAFYGQIDFYDFLGSAIILSIYVYSSYKKIN